MKPGLLKTVLAAAALAASLTPSIAEARRVRYGVAAQARVTGGVSVSVGTPPPPPVAYGYGCDCPPPPPAYPAYPQYYAPPPPPTMVVAASAPRRPIFGIGLLASTIDINDGELEGQGVGLLGRLRLGQRLQLELQLSADEFVDSPRIDTRFGAAALIGLGEPGGFTPYVLVGAGVNVIHPLGEDDQTDPDALPTQGYLEAGVGLEWEIVPHLALSGDVRLQARRFDEHNKPALHLQPTLSEKEDAAEARVNLILYF